MVLLALARRLPPQLVVFEVPPERRHEVRPDMPTRFTLMLHPDYHFAPVREEHAEIYRQGDAENQNSFG